MKSDPFDVIAKYQKPVAPVIASSDPTEGRIIAYLIATEVLGADIWLSFRNDFKPDESEPLAVFYADEIWIVAQKTPEQLRELHKVKLVFPECRVIQEGPEAKS